MAHPVVAIHAIHNPFLGAGDLLRRQGIGHVAVFDGPSIGQGSPYPADVLLVRVGSDVFHRVGDVPVDAMAQSLSALASPGLEDQVGALLAVILVGLKAPDLPHGVTVEGGRPVTALARFVGRAHGL